MMTMIIRVRTPDGQHRLEVNQDADTRTIRKKLIQVLHVDDSTQIVAALDPKGVQMIDFNDLYATASSLGLLNGSLLYVECRKSVTPSTIVGTGNGHTATKPLTEGQYLPTVNSLSVIQDPIDNEIEKHTGKIQRNRDPHFCKHGDRAMCDYCSPLEPYDAKFLESNKIKHMSFHAYLRQLIDQNKTPAITSPQFIPPLEVMSFKVKNPCPSKSHGPYPAGICTKCQPSAVSLNPQSFRMVDFLEFETPAIIDGFLSSWRKSGIQRLGYLYGRYEPYNEVPLGVKAVVAAIYEPPQIGELHGLQLTLPDPREEHVDQIAALMGLTKVGMVYTDLLDDGIGEGTVFCRRHASSFFLSSAECIFAAQMQLKHQTSSKYSPTGVFGSRFVTCVLSGNEEGNIDFFTYQVSNMVMAMTRDNVIEASVDPTLVRVRESTAEQYIPELFYKYKNEYGIMVQESAKPTFPVEYLLITVSHGFPINPAPTFVTLEPFQIENREVLEGYHQDLAAVRNHLDKGPLTTTLSDFHLIIYLYTLSILDEVPFKLVCSIAKTQSDTEVQQLLHTDAWQTLSTILRDSSSIQSGPGPSSSKNASGGGGVGNSEAGGELWECAHCTFRNPVRRGECEMCGLPKG